MDGHREDGHRQEQRRTFQHPAGHPSEQQDTPDPTDERKEPQRHLREPEQLDRRQLGPEKEDRADLPILQGREQVEVAATRKAEREAGLVTPDGIIGQVAADPQQYPERHERQNGPVDSPSVWDQTLQAPVDLSVDYPGRSRMSLEVVADGFASPMWSQ